MKMKRFTAVLLSGVMAAALTACGSKDPAYLSGINPEDYVQVADYSNISVEEAQPSVSDDTVESYIQYTLTSNQETQEVTDRDDVEDGDIVNIDYTGTKDGVAFDGGSATDYDLTIGSGTFIDGFEDGLIGHKKGETVTLNLTFPDDYSNKDLAGQAVVFKVTINKISTKVTPELTDEWVQGQNITGVDTVEEYRKYVREQLMSVAQSDYNDDVQNKIVDYLMDNSTFTQDPPQEMIDRYFDLYEQRLSSAASQYGMDLDTYASLSGLVTDDSSSASSDSTEDSDEGSTESAEASTEAAGESTESSVSEDTESSEAATAAAEAVTEDDTAASTEASTEAGSADTASTEAASDAAESSSESSTEGSTESETMNDQTRAAITDLAKNQAKQLILLGAIAQKEDLKISEREYENAVATQAPSMGYTGLDDFEEGQDEEMFKEYLLEQKVVEFLQGKTTVNEPADESSTESSTEAATEAATESSTEAATESAAETASTAE